MQWDRRNREAKRKTGEGGGEGAESNLFLAVLGRVGVFFFFFSCVATAGLILAWWCIYPMVLPVHERLLRGLGWTLPLVSLISEQARFGRAGLWSRGSRFLMTYCFFFTKSVALQNACAAVVLSACCKSLLCDPVLLLCIPQKYNHRGHWMQSQLLRTSRCWPKKCRQR